ncbi:hypothetical protein SAMN05443377_11563 [Propionibacterium cyclohexanicum]|uniref:Uncharacterized protein n=1 Tax=Propionibacterium cyclohexanicum TaxID=64702 RepID=A0A1H9SSC5_9ACTN|nr:hypothetical protein [Propionibacterium cyclohexanicum]SER87866.1 hypothetical protein SAMN05443377_11563 [Propionibacterium cyclohexanicum]
MSEPQQPHPTGPGGSQDPAYDVDPYGDQPLPAPGRDSAAWQASAGAAGDRSRRYQSPPSPSTARQDSDVDASARSASEKEQGDTAAITAYQLRPRRGPILLVALLTVAVVAAIIVVATRRPSIDPSPGAVTPTPQVSSPAAPQPATSPPPGTASVTNTIPVSTSGFSGTWTIDSTTWDTEGVVVQMTLTADSGSLSYMFFGLDNASTDQVRATGPMSDGRISAGQTQRGEIRMDKQRGDTTLILANSSQRQITALLIPG